MAAQVGSLFVSLTADVRPFAAAMQGAQRVTNAATTSIRRNVALTDRAVGNAQRSMSQGFRPYGIIAAAKSFNDLNDRTSLLRGSLLALTGIFGGFTAALASNVVLRYADSFQKLQNQMMAVSKTSWEAQANLAGVAEVAERSRSSLASTAQLFSRIARASPDMKPEELLQYVETIQKALQLGGATAEEANSAAIQFSQAIASNRFQGDELRQILETPLGLELAKGIGVTTAQLRKMGAEGSLTSKVVLGGLKNIKSEIDNKFAKSILTLDQSFTQLDNALTLSIGKFNEAHGITRLLSQGIMAVAHNSDAAVQAVATLGAVLAAVFGGRFLGRMAQGAAGRIGGIVAAPGQIATAARDQVASLQAQVAEQQGQLRTLQKEALGLRLARRNAPLTLAQGSAVSEYLRAQQALQALENQEIAITQRLQAAYARVAAAGTASARERAAAQRSLNAAMAASVAFGMAAPGERQTLTRNILATRGRAQASGVSSADMRLTEIGAQMTGLRGTIAGGVTQLVAVERAASRGGVAMTVFRNSVAGVLGVFGGPWGAAITTLIVGAGLIFDKMASAAEEARQVKAVQEEILGTIAGAGGDNAAIAAQALQDKKIQAANERLEAQYRALVKINDEMEKIFAFQRDINQMIAVRRFFGSQESATPIDVQAVRELVQAFATSTMSAQEFRDEMEQLRANTNAPKEITDNMLDLAQQTKDATLTVQGLTRALDEIRNPAAPIVPVKPPGTKPLTTGFDEQNKKSQSTYEKAFEKTQEIIDKIRRESMGAFMGDLDQKVIEKAQNIQFAAERIREYVDAVNAGDLSKAPKELLQMRDALIELGAAETWKGIIQNYGTVSDLTTQFADKQAELQFLLSKGLISTEMSQKAWADFVTSFGQYKWIDDVASAFNEFAMSAIFDFDNIGDSALNFLKRLEQIAIQILVMEPLVAALRTALAPAGPGGGNIFSGIGSFITSILSGGAVPAAQQHSGGRAGSGPTRMMPAGIFANAPRFHGGRLMAGELPAVLKDDETVYTPAQRQSMMDSRGDHKVEIINQTGQPARKQEGTGPNLERYIIGAMQTAIGSGKLDAAFGSRYAARPRQTGR